MLRVHGAVDDSVGEFWGGGQLLRCGEAVFRGEPVGFPRGAYFFGVDVRHADNGQSIRVNERLPGINFGACAHPDNRQPYRMVQLRRLLPCGGIRLTHRVPANDRVHLRPLLFHVRHQRDLRTAAIQIVFRAGDGVVRVSLQVIR